MGKMLLFSAVLGCLDPVLTICAAQGLRDPFVAPLHARQQVDHIRASLVGNTHSDHLLLHSVYVSWKAAEVAGLGHRFCDDNFVSSSVMRSMERTREQLRRCLSSTHSYLMASGSSSNRHSQNLALVKAVILASYFPNILEVYSLGNNGSRLKLRSECNCRVAPHPRSVNSRASMMPYRWLLFQGKTRSDVSKRLFAECTTGVSSMALLLFGTPPRLDQPFESLAKSDSDLLLSSICLRQERWVVCTAPPSLASLLRQANIAIGATVQVSVC
jgi:ATP-dependent RNA helicase DHX36